MKNEDMFKREAKMLVDQLFNTKVFRDDITRDDMNNIEEFLSYLLNSKFEMHLKGEALLRSLSDSVKENQNNA
jgi:hypothetical protein